MERKLYFMDSITNRKELFIEALESAKMGKVLYILCNEINELPELSQELVSLNRHYMKMITFLYAKTVESLIESLASLPDWQCTPSTIILDGLSTYCDKDDLETACTIIALLIDSVRSCSSILNIQCKLVVSINKEDIEDDQVFRDLYFDSIINDSY